MQNRSFVKIIKLALLNVFIVTLVGLIIWTLISYSEGAQVSFSIVITIIIIFLIIIYLVKDLLEFYRTISK